MITNNVPASASETEVQCPEANATVFLDPTTEVQFQRTCGVQHPGYDIDNREAESMEACMSWCAETNGCHGVTWFDAGPQGTDLNYCWLKSNVDGETRFTNDAQSAVRL